jgi:hypothetical protein
MDDQTVEQDLAEHPRETAGIGRNVVAEQRCERHLGVHGVLRFEGAYLRFSGEIRVEHYQGAEIVDQHVAEDAIWELMYFGHART